MQKKYFAIIGFMIVAIVAPPVVRGMFLYHSHIQGTLTTVLPSDTLSDPVVEEPIRPLLPSGSTNPAGDIRRCGAVQGSVLVFGLASLAPLRLLRRRSEP